MRCLDHSVKVLCRLRVGHHSWVEDPSVKNVLAAAKADVQNALLPGRNPEGSKEDNTG